ncbi:MAG: hypothetical protein WCX79_00410 [Candidatus Paceibacterota bacterium]
MTTYTKEEWDSRKITYDGFMSAILDILFMALYLLGGMAFLIYASTNVTPYYLTWGYLAVGIFLTVNAIVVKFFHLLQPRDWYETEITMMKKKV